MNKSVAVSDVFPMSVTLFPTWFTAGMFSTWNTASTGAFRTPVPAEMPGMVHVISPVAESQTGWAGMVLITLPVHVHRIEDTPIPS